MKLKKLKAPCSLLLALILAILPVCSVYAEDGEVVEAVQETIEEATPDNGNESQDTIEQLSDEGIQESQESYESSEAISESIEVTTDTNTQLMDAVGGGTFNTYPGDTADNTSGECDYTTDDNLNILIRGLTPSNYEGTINLINQYWSQIEGSGVGLNMSGDFIDAEKFNETVAGYDSELCWAATASNILWSTGYAQTAGFNSVDEVLTYYSERFTDYPSSPSEAIDWFFNGDGAYSLQGTANVSQYKTDANNASVTGNANGLYQLPDGQTVSDISGLTNVSGTATTDPGSAISVIKNLATYGVGALVRWVNDDGSLTSGAHWMAVFGAITDNNATDPTAQYKGIILANSDNDPVNGDISNTTADQKTDAKANQPNKYSVYRLTYDNTYGWCIDGFANAKTVITYLYSLLDKDKVSTPTGGDVSGGPEETYSYTNDDGYGQIDSDVRDAEKKHSIDINENSTDEVEQDSHHNASEHANKKNTEYKSNIANISYFDSLTREQLEQEENIAKLFECMINKGIPVYSLANGKLVESADYEVYMAVPETFVYGVLIDDVELPFDQYLMTSTKSGLSKLIIKDSYLKKLTPGKHTISVKVQGMDIVICFDVVRM